MINYLMELLLFLVPGVLAELLFCYLKERDSAWWVRVSRIVLFSMVCLALRAAVSVVSGHGDAEISVVFHGTGNYLKYCIISAFVIAFVPPCRLILEKLLPGRRDKAKK